MHEEFHRAVLGNRAVGSFDDVYKLNLGADVINVSHVTDADLVRFKALHPTEFVRAAEAGIEGENQLIEGLEKSRFFRDSHSNNVSLYWMTKINSAWYVWSGISGDADSLMADANRFEGADVAKRDWVGHDFTAWVHDLFRPDEPYTARGIDPSGVGINRYVKASDLTPEEHDFLQREGHLQLINFLDPSLFAFGGVTVRDPWRQTNVRLNVSASHYLTSFGHAIDMNVFLREGAANVFVVLHRYTNGARTMPGAEIQVLDAPISLAGRDIVVSPRVALWMQPRDQAFRTTDSQVGPQRERARRRVGKAQLRNVNHVIVEPSRAGARCCRTWSDVGRFRSSGTVIAVVRRGDKQILRFAQDDKGASLRMTKGLRAG